MSRKMHSLDDDEPYIPSPPSPGKILDQFAAKPLTKLVQRQASFTEVARLKMGGMSDMLARLYASRGITSPKDVKGTYADLLPIDSMKGVREMASYLADCRDSGKRVLIVSDYDCDGATACSILVMAFGAIGMNYDYLVPDRQIHGYGLTPAIVEAAAQLQDKPDVIITVDNGISSHAGIDRAKELGIDVLVTDHHLAPEVLPDACIIVNPNQAGCNFESKNIAGCGVAWYVARALVEELIRRGSDPEFDPAELLSYVALGTVADVVKLDTNNRIMVALGLEYIRSGQCAPGIPALAKVSGKNHETLSCSDIGFGIGPRINAAGRLAHMGAGIECLTCLDLEMADHLAAQLHVTNEERKEIQVEIVTQAADQAIPMLASALSQAAIATADSHGMRSLVVFRRDWHEGVVGIVAGRLKEEFHRPTIVMTGAHGGDIKGSGRSIPGFHLKHALDEINIKYPGVLLKFGGHAMAAGMTIAGDKLDVFKDAFEEVCQHHLTPEIMTKTLAHDGPLSPRDFTVERIHEISQQVWGQGFEEPVFVNDLVVSEVKLIGKDKNHLKIIGHLANDPDKALIDVMAFGRGDLVEEVGAMQTIQVAFKPGVNTFRGQRRLQLLVELMPHEMTPDSKITTRLTSTRSIASLGSHAEPQASTAPTKPQAPILAVAQVRAAPAVRTLNSSRPTMKSVVGVVNSSAGEIVSAPKPATASQHAPAAKMARTMASIDAAFSSQSKKVPEPKAETPAPTPPSPLNPAPAPVAAPSALRPNPPVLRRIRAK